ncbi:ribonuclease R [Candidatus Adlerbacteria bacterium RIFCSPHIGHO2_01_FULL_54_23]|uniref:Ribonuclease R n=2 Tax=Candidatus Adleribacteriota TaxID=1752736 RepID=A0A1F4XZE6_9BACT|nr:MAG: ribonuclease R [Candidatus Adlerbacteria bacterium GW2011_GWB1_54_7]OGC78796.1 MAG: ribonuclease R [Candidatus Adlerbacteria bacterium RIFCSPHIGHO2_01_FULL_54_23]OGC87095.1 MAG: ribonuclease R [Candidatus Adlerbacteria bacterium RIFCSPLOWO2_01_FULL_54_16]
MRNIKGKKHITGIIELTRKAVGYVAWEKDKEDIEIRTDDLGGALNGDTVEVELAALFPRPKGKVKKIITRAKEDFVGTIIQGDALKQGSRGAVFVQPDDIKFYRPIQIKGRDFAEGEKVLIHLDFFDGIAAKGTVIEHLGKAGEHRVEMNAIVLEHGFRTDFPTDVLAEAQALGHDHDQILKSEAARRTDFRGTPTFTIDPADAKDFDDALSCVAMPNGEFEIGVHIADATFFCRPGTAIDDEARRRGTSVYLVDATIPMLPHEISAGVASLKPGEDRLAFSAVFRMNKNAEVLGRKFQKSVIRSDRRFTYEEAQMVLDTADAKVRPSQACEGLTFANELLILQNLARILRKNREKEGAIDFGDSEVHFELDKNGKPLSVRRKERMGTNLLIEEFMLLANREVASYISKLAENVPEKNLIFLYRIHDEPKSDRIEELATFVRAVGYEFGKNKQKKFSTKDIQKLLKQIEGKPEEHLIRTATLRSMAKAIYSTKNIGHFGLAFEYYTHFTSPIRRYPDMLAHRILESHLNGKPITRKEYANLEKMCIEASEAEARAVDAERESVRYKQVEYMQDKIGQTFDGVISGVTEWGLYVEEKESAAEGLVHVRTLRDDYYNYSQKEYALVGARKKKKYALGDSVRVRLIAADLAMRQLDFELT